jgi:hypothetical protein
MSFDYVQAKKIKGRCWKNEKFEMRHSECAGQSGHAGAHGSLDRYATWLFDSVRLPPSAMYDIVVRQMDRQSPPASLSAIK